MNRFTVGVLLAVIVAAFGLRFFELGRADVIYDESINSFRALGYLDWFAEPGQATTVDLFAEPPAWTKLSFHDHPPLWFLTQHLVFKITGPTAWATRAVSAAAGVAAVYLAYLIGRNLFGQTAGLAAAALLAVNSSAVWISRIGLQESLLIALLLASVYFFIRATEKLNYLFLSFGFLGLAILTKYTAAVLVPVYGIIAVFYCRAWFAKPVFYASAAAGAAVLLPVVVYNAMLLATLGHLDLQLSYLFNQQQLPHGWDSVVGRSDLSWWQATIALPGQLAAQYTWAVLAAVAAASVWLLTKLKSGWQYVLLFSLLACLDLLMLATGAQARFLTMYAPAFALTIAGAFWFFAGQPRTRTYAYAGVVLLLAVELAYTVDTFFVAQPVGAANIAYADSLHRLRKDWGFNALEKYLSAALDGHAPALRFALSNSYLENRVAATVDSSPLPAKAALIIYDFNLKDGPDIWYLKRRQFYEGWPVVTADTVLKEWREQGSEYYRTLGFDTFYFVAAAPGALLRDSADRSAAASDLSAVLVAQGVTPVVLFNSRGEASLFVYEF